MDKWFAIPDSTKRNAYIQIAEKTGMAAYAVEKDWWVVQTLAIIFEMEVAEHLVFKGGTSLRKAWKLIDRFSEDIDLAIDRKFLNYHSDAIKSVRAEINSKISDVLFKFTLFLLAAQFVFTMILLFFLS